MQKRLDLITLGRLAPPKIHLWKIFLMMKIQILKMTYWSMAFFFLDDESESEEGFDGSDSEDEEANEDELDRLANSSFSPSRVPFRISFSILGAIVICSLSASNADCSSAPHLLCPSV